jgi:hypothetical protein
MTSQSIVFALLVETTPAEQEGALDAIASFVGVTGVQRLVPDSPIPELRRLGVATVADGVDVYATAQLIQSIRDVEYAEPAAARF